VDAVAVEVVIEAKSTCSDRARAQAALTDALATARAPKRGTSSSWIVELAVENGSAAATILDDRGEVVAERTVTDHNARACLPFARAVAAWAALVLDDELARARDAAEVVPPARRASSASVAESSPVLTPQETPPGYRDRDEPAPAKDRTIEIGMMGYLRDGLVASSGFAGATPFVTVEVQPSWFVRPALAFGTSTTADVPYWHAGGRFDFCRRIPGNYMERRGLELDLCLGAEGSDVASRTGSALRVAGGPSGSFRGELGAGTSLELRLAGGYNFARAALDKEEQPAAVYSEIDLGMSWRFR